ncbi:peptidylprolyl isomerase [uncultured Dechloromonas sp.]|uniref:peptidylprolyl isomerase n=1 Tax=uncultured Dechloromonas sp. TaxID=171719 RepID=UPI0025E83724|nr:peptidylprolyl isomerase [uncultured Dechloromonas sp.]
MLKKVSLLAAGLLASALAWANPTVEMTTNLGKFTLELYPDKAPKTVEMFLYNAKHGFYEATVFHRVIDGFMIQGGGFNSSMEEKKTRTPALPNEATNGLTNDRGTVAMARTQDPHSARVQFFVNLKNNDFLNHRSPADGRSWGYAVFGKVTQGMEVIDKIAKVPTGNAGYYENVPTTPVVIQNVKIISEK